MTVSEAPKVMRRHCVVIQHLLFEDLGSLAPFLSEQGYSVEYFQAGVNLPDLSTCLAADMVVVLGGPIGVNDASDYPFLAEEFALVKSLLNAEQPLIGICLGAQLIAKVLGAEVYARSEKEIGWASISLTDAGKSSPLRHLDGIDVLHWHGETFDLPDGATLLASTVIAPHQAFSIGNNVLAIQFHLEADATRIEQWLIGHACELSGAGISPVGIREDAQRLGAKLAEAGRKVMAEWMGNL